VASRYLEEKAKREEKREMLVTNREHLKRIADDNNAVESKTALLERQVQTRRQDLSEAQGKLGEFKDEIEVLKAELASGAASLLKKRAENATMQRELESKEAKLEAARKGFQAIKLRLDKEGKTKVAVEHTAKQAEAALGETEVALKREVQKLQSLKESMFKQSQQLFALRQEEANLIAEISGAQAAGRNLVSKIRG